LAVQPPRALSLPDEHKLALEQINGAIFQLQTILADTTTTNRQLAAGAELCTGQVKKGIIAVSTLFLTLLGLLAGKLYSDK